MNSHSSWIFTARPSVRTATQFWCEANVQLLRHTLPRGSRDRGGMRADSSFLPRGIISGKSIPRSSARVPPLTGERRRENKDPPLVPVAPCRSRRRNNREKLKRVRKTLQTNYAARTRAVHLTFAKREIRERGASAGITQELTRGKEERSEYPGDVLNRLRVSSCGYIFSRQRAVQEFRACISSPLTSSTSSRWRGDSLKKGLTRRRRSPTDAISPGIFPNDVGS